jgi:trigger factor
LQEDIREKLKERIKNEQEQKVRLALLDAVIAKSQVKVPQRLVAELLEEERKLLQRSGRQLSEEDVATLKEALEQRLKRDRVLQAIKQKENIRLSDEQFEEFLKQEAERRGTNPVKFKALLEREGQLDRLRQDRENQQVLDLLVEKAHIIERSSSPKSKSKQVKPEDEED